MKKELRKESVYKKLTNFQFESEIAKKLGTNRNKIYKLKRKLGQTRKYTIKKVTNKNNMETKTELIRKFDQLKKEKIYGFKYDKQKRNKIEREIANELGINRNKIYYWKNEIGLLNGLSNQQKLEKIEQFEKVREEFAKKFNLKTTKKINGKIAEKICVVLRTIYRWKRKFGFTSQKTNMDADVLAEPKKNFWPRKMVKINFLIIFFLFLIVLINGIDEDLFDDLWKNLKPSTSKNYKKPKIGEINAIKEEVDNENYEQQNANQIEMEEIKPKLFQKIKNEKTLEKQNNNTKIKVPKIELDKLNKESFENDFYEQVDQNISSTDQSNSADDEDYNNMESEKRNKYILNKYNLMKKELKKENIYKNLKYVKFECEIAKKSDINRTKIYKLKKKLGQKREKRTEENKETKMEVIRKFDQLKKEKIHGFKYNRSEICKIECEIASELGINRKKIYKWKKEFGLLKGFSNQQKLEKIMQFEKVKEEFAKKFNLKTNRKIDEKIAKKIGVGLVTIYRWKRKIGFSIRKSRIYSDAEKLEYVKRNEEMKKSNPMISETKIAEKLGIPSANLGRWKKKFGTKSIR